MIVAALHGRAAVHAPDRPRITPGNRPPYIENRKRYHRPGGTSPALLPSRFSFGRGTCPELNLWSVSGYVSGLHGRAAPCDRAGRDETAPANVPHAATFLAAGPSATTYNPRSVGSPWANEPGVSSHIIRSRPGPSGELNLGFGGVCSRALPPCGMPVRRRHGLGVCRPTQSPSRLCSPPPTRSQGASRETKARYGDRCPLSPRGRVREWASGVWGCRTAPSERGGPSAALSVAVGCLP